MRFLKHLNTSKKLLILILICSVIPSVIAVATSGVYYMKKYEEQLFAVKGEQLNALKASYDTCISEAENIAMQIINNYRFYSEQKSDTSKLPTIDIQQMMNFNSSMLSVKNSLESIYIMPYNSDKMIVNTSFYDVSSFPDKECISLISGKSDLRMQHIPSRDVPTLEGKIEPCYTLIVPFINVGTTNYSYAVINISIMRFLYNQIGNSAEKYCVFRNGSLLFTNLNTVEKLEIPIEKLDSEIKIEGEKYTFINSKADNSGLLFVSMNKSSDLFSPISSLKLVFFCILLMTLLLAILFSTKLSQRIYHPVVTLFELLKTKHNAPFDDDVDELAYIERYISDFEQERNINSGLSRKYMLQQLIRNEYWTIENTVPNNLLNSIFVVFTAEYHGYDSLKGTFPDFLFELLSDNMLNGFEFEVFDIDSHNTSAILFAEHQKTPLLTKAISEMLNALSTKISKHTKSVFISSSTAVNINEVHNEFIDTLSALKQKIYCDDSDLFIFTHSVEQNPNHGINSYFFDFENKLLSAIKTKDMDSVCICLDECFTYLKKEKINADSVVGWLMILRDEIFDIPLSLGYSATEIFYKDIEQLKKSFKYNKTISDYESYFKKIAQLTILGITVKTSKKHTVLLNDIKNFIQNNLENDTSLNTIAAMYHITPQYLSQLFKKHTGETFISYTTRLKIEKAKNLLAQTTLSPEEISASVGYTNTRSFYASFKKYTYMSPIEYRKQNSNF